nr:MAG TPA: hypothetical protein [Caudoviricetes sp.]
MTCPGAIPLKTAVFACARASQYGVTIKRGAQIKTAPLWGGDKIIYQG